MNGSTFKLRRPCAKCPFRADVPGYLRRERALEIAESLAGGAVFPCHETTVTGWDEEGEETLVAGDDSQFCAGALLVMERMEQPNQIVRIAERLGEYDAARMDMSAPVYPSLFAFVEAHGPDEPAWETCSVVNAGCDAPAGMMHGSVPLPTAPDGEVHECPSCAEPVCENCSNDEGTCYNCQEGDDDDG